MRYSCLKGYWSINSRTNQKLWTAQSAVLLYKAYIVISHCGALDCTHDMLLTSSPTYILLLIDGRRMGGISPSFGWSLPGVKPRTSSIGKLECCTQISLAHCDRTVDCKLFVLGSSKRLIRLVWLGVTSCAESQDLGLFFYWLSTVRHHPTRSCTLTVLNDSRIPVRTTTHPSASNSGPWLPYRIANFTLTFYILPYTTLP